MQTLHRFKLKTGKLQHIQIGLVLLDQIQRRRPQVATHTHISAGLPRHGAQQSGYRTFTIGTGNGDNRRQRSTGEQLNITDNFNATLLRLHQQRFLQRHARAHQNAFGAGEDLCIEATRKQRHIRQLPLHVCQRRRLFTAVDNCNLHTTLCQETRT